MGLVDVKIFIFTFSYFISDFDRVCGRLHGLIGACMSDLIRLLSPLSPT